MAMKFKTFRNIVIGVGILIVGGGVYAWNATHPSQPPYSEKWTPGKTKTKTADGRDLAKQQRLDLEAKANKALRNLQKNRDPHADPVLAAILERIEQGCSASKIKDALKGRTYKVNLYGKNGQVVRLKVDLDRDDRWDEKWTLEAPGQLEGLKRQISTADDGVSYDRELIYRGGVFRPKGAAPVKPPPSSGGGTPEPSDGGTDPSGDSTGNLEPHQVKLIEQVQRGIGGPGKKLKDPWKSGPKVNVYHDEGKTIPNRAKVDLDRDGKWDEKWNFEPLPGGLKVKRQVSTADDNVSYDRDYRLREGSWVLKE
ncbi:MAG: hypothetical protein JKY65_08115 [Planctomycetes bacterium]|nr:hypothetical protein [Planctomycetota bacterium]